MLVATLAFAFALLAASALVVVLFWDTYRIAALCGVTIVYLLIGVAAALWRFTRQRPPRRAPLRGDAGRARARPRVARRRGRGRQVSGELQALRAERKALLATRAELDRARICARACAEITDDRRAARRRPDRVSRLRPARRVPHLRIGRRCAPRAPRASPAGCASRRFALAAAAHRAQLEIRAPSGLQPELAPQRVDARLHRRIHRDRPAPRARRFRRATCSSRRCPSCCRDPDTGDAKSR